MKKFLSLFLVLTMVLSMLTLPTMADEQGEEAPATTLPTPQRVVSEKDLEGKDSVEYNGKTYTVIRDLAGFENMDAVDGKGYYILAANIDFNHTFAGAASGDYNYGTAAVINGPDNNGFDGEFHFEGNGYRLQNLYPRNATGAGLFSAAVGDVTTISNVYVDIVDAFTFANNCAGVLVGTSGDIGKTDVSGYEKTHLYFNNVAVTVADMAGSNQNHAVFVAKARCPVTITGCTVNGKIAFSGNNAGKAAFVGVVDKKVTITIDNCHANLELKSDAGRSAVFVGYNKGATATFSNCSVTGELNFSSTQASAFLGCVDNSGKADFSNCTVDTTVYFGNNKSGAFVGQAYTGGTIDLTDCTVSGIIVSATDCNGAFMGVAGGAYTSDPTNEPTRQAPEITFTGCDVDALIIAAGTASAYVGSGNAGNPTIVYDACENNATIYSFGTAGAWYGGDSLYYGYSTNGTNVTVNDNCTNNATIYAVARGEADDCDEGTVNYVDTTVNFTEISAEALADGSYAYAVAQAQKAKGMTTNLVGQTIGTDAKPRVGGATVYKFVTNKVGTFYSNNAEYVYTQTDKVAAQYTAPDGEGKFNTRVIIAVSEAKLAEIARVGITLTFKNGDEVVNTKTFGQGGIDSYYAVYAGDQIAQAAEGYVLVAVTVTGIPTAEWQKPDAKTNTCTISVTMEAFDANGYPMPEYTLA